MRTAPPGVNRFKKIYVEITNVCNLSCSICPGTERPPLSMAPADFETALKKIKPFTGHIYLHVMGEPLLHPRLGEILELAGRHRFRTNITTNGALAKERGRILLGAKTVRQINFSIHCLDVQREKSLPPSYLSDILDFIGEGLASTGIYFAVRIWNLRPGEAPSSEILSMISDRFNIPSGIICSANGGSSNHAAAGCASARITLLPRLFLNLAEEFKWPDATSGKDSRPGRAFCRGLRDHCAILADGTVVPCCLDKDGAVPLGNIFRSELQQILDGTRARAIVEGFSQGRAVEKLCSNCEFRRRFADRGIMKMS